jgi:hypothetical protein
MEWNGMEWNGMEWNASISMKWITSIFNGIEMKSATVDCSISTRLELFKICQRTPATVRPTEGY